MRGGRQRIRIAGTWVAAMLLVPWGGAPVVAQEPEAYVPDDVQLEVYVTALAFYAPPPGQVRWLEATPLYEEQARPPFDYIFLRALIGRLGDGFRLGSRGENGQGGRLRLSAIRPLRPSAVRPLSSRLYRLAIGYRHHTEHQDGPASAQTFLVRCDAAGCRIVQMAPVAAPGAW